MPWTAHRIVDDESIHERAAVVGAVSADGEYLRAAAREQHRLFSDVTDKLAAVRQFGGGDASRQIGAD
jgi:hypothetical protein